MVWWRKLWPFGKQVEEKQEKKRMYQGAVYNRLTNDWNVSATSADSEIVTSLRPLRNRSRSLCRDNDYAKGAVRTICNNIVGKGISLQAKVKQQRGTKYDEKINTLIEELWSDWGDARYCDVAGKLDFTDIERLAMRSIIESGEVLIRLVRKAFDGSPVPLALELIESDQLADDQWSGLAPNGNEIRMGVEIDKWNRPVAYHLYEKHPGDYQFTSSVGQRLIRVPAEEMIHLFLCDRPGQTRGVPWFHTALLTFRHVGGYTEAELVAARAQAAVMGFIQTPDGDVYAPQEFDGQRITSLEPGAIEVLNPGESFEGFAPTRPNQGFDAFVRVMLRGVAAGIGLSYEALSRDFSNTSYSSARTSLMDERDNYRVVQAWFIRRLHKRVYEKWLDLAVLSGSLNLPSYEVKRRFYQKVKFTARGWQWVDPQNEVQANKEGVKAGFLSVADVVSQQGLDVEDVLAEQKRVLDMAKDLGLSLDVLVEGGGEGENAEPMGGLTPTRAGFTRTFTKSFRAKNCKKGIACGNSCISKGKTCKKTLTPSVQQLVPPAKAKTKKGKKTTPGDAPAPPPPATKSKELTVIDSRYSGAYDDIVGAIEVGQEKLRLKDQYNDAYVDNARIWTAMSRVVDNKLNDEKQGVFVKDESGKLQAGATYEVKGRQLHIDLLASHPDNIDPSNPDRVRGSGTQVMVALAKKAVNQKKEIALSALPGAESYYEKLGFEKLKGKDADGYSKYRLKGDALKNLASLGG